jgi:membrane-bound lytic murein transglycosylase F
MNKRFLILSAAIVLFLVIFLWIGRSGEVRDLPQILEEGRLTVLIESGEHGFARDSVKVYGFQYELIKKISDSMGVELVVINQAGIKDGLSELKTGKCDVLVSLRPMMTDSLRSVVSLLPIVTTRIMLVQKQDSVGKRVISKQYELNADTIAVVDNSPYIRMLKNLEEELAIDLTIDELSKQCLDDIIRLVDEGAIKYTTCPEYLTKRFKNSYPDLDFSLPLSFKHDLSWKVNKHSPQLQNHLNDFLDGFIGTAEFITLYNKYFSQPLTTNH